MLVARKGGEVFLRKRFSAARVDRGMALYQRFGLLAVVVPSLLPPPTPFKIFVLMAGAAAVAPWRFALAIVIGRGIRYFGQGYLAVRYGETRGRDRQGARRHGRASPSPSSRWSSVPSTTGSAAHGSQPSRAGRSAMSNGR